MGIYRVGVFLIPFFPHLRICTREFSVNLIFSIKTSFALHDLHDQMCLVVLLYTHQSETSLRPTIEVFKFEEHVEFSEK